MPAPALTAIAAFNLICTGTLRTGPLGLAMPEAGGEPYTITYRIDLASNLWCSDECASPEPIVLVTDTEILLREAHVPSGGRTTIVGRHDRAFRGHLDRRQYRHACAAAAASRRRSRGFPCGSPV